MTKDIGRQATYGAPYSLLPKVEASTSTNPSPKTIKRIQEQSQLRIDIKKYTPGLSFRSQGSYQLNHSSYTINQLCVASRVFTDLSHPTICMYVSINFPT
jgi:hypothetical protein